MTEYFLREKTIRDIVTIHERLSTAPSLAPSPWVNDHFSKLVGIVDSATAGASRKILESPRIASIRQELRLLAAEGEAELERFWAERVLEGPDARRTLAEFPYYENYERMAEFESENLAACGVRKGSRILFVGSGPLPLTAMLLAEGYGFEVDCLDMDPGACDLSKKVIRALGLTGRVRVRQGNALELTDFTGYDAVFVAALVGRNEHEKADVVDHVAEHAQPGTHVVLRNVSDLGALLYPAVDERRFADIEVVKRSARPAGVINGIIIGKIIAI